MGNWCWNLPCIPKSVDAQVLYRKWCSIYMQPVNILVYTLNKPLRKIPNTV